MPIYEYQCAACGHKEEVLQKLSDPPLVTCPSCHEDAMTKLVSAAGFRLSGTGWYETDFKSDKKKNLSKNDADKPKSDSIKKEESKPKETKKSDTSSSSSSSTGNSAS